MRSADGQLTTPSIYVGLLGIPLIQAPEDTFLDPTSWGKVSVLDVIDMYVSVSNRINYYRMCLFDIDNIFRTLFYQGFLQKVFV